MSEIRLTDEQFDKIKGALETADNFCGEHTPDECPDFIAIPIKEALSIISSNEIEPTHKYCLPVESTPFDTDAIMGKDLSIYGKESETVGNKTEEDRIVLILAEEINGGGLVNDPIGYGRLRPIARRFMNVKALAAQEAREEANRLRRIIEDHGPEGHNITNRKFVITRSLMALKEKALTDINNIMWKTWGVSTNDFGREEGKKIMDILEAEINNSAAIAGKEEVKP